jgi:probable phosphoglycerate mutase
MLKVFAKSARQCNSYVSPRRRAQRTLELLSLGCPDPMPWQTKRGDEDADVRTSAKVEVTEDVREWDYGDYEGLTTPEIRQTVPDWMVWTHGCPGGESVAQVGERADRAVVLALTHMATRDVVFVGHGHFSRTVLTRWVELPVSEGIRVSMAAASIAVCGYEHGVSQITALGLTGHVNPCLPP